MELLVLLVVLPRVGVAPRCGWGVDTREPHNNWDRV